MKIQTLVCSVNRYFIESFSTYTMECASSEFEFSFFTDKAAAISYIENHKIDLILADDSFVSENVFSPKTVRVSIASMTIVNPEHDCHELNIYQRGVDILADLKKIVSTVNGNNMCMCSNNMF